ncbi:MAG TPA: spermine synthase, partial [bacterium]|nr:spermine synthase [bacterium]
MKKRYTLAVLIMGFSGLAAQIILLRELLITFFGNELSIGIILANWLILEAAGCLLLGRVIDRVNKHIAAFVLVSLVFSICLPAMVFLTRIIKEVIGVTAGEGLGILPILYTSFFILLPVSVTHGALFTFSCKITSSDTLEKSSAVGRVYIYEILGTIAGGICITYLFIPFFNSLQAAFFVALLNIALCLMLLGPFWRNTRNLSTKFLGILSSILLLIGFFSAFGKTSDRLHGYSINRQWKGQNLLHYENSVYGNIAVVERGGEYTFFSSGLPVFTAPNPDTVFIEEFAHLPLLAHPEPKEILVISGGIGGLINEILKHPVERVDYAEIDPLILKVAAKFHSEITVSELSDPRTNIYTADGRLFIRETARKYDLV